MWGIQRLGLALAACACGATAQPFFIGLGERGDMYRFGFSGDVEPLGVIQLPTGAFSDIVTGLTRSSDGRWFASRTTTGRLLEFSGPGSFAVVRPSSMPRGVFEVLNWALVADAATSRLYMSVRRYFPAGEVPYIAILDIDTRAVIGTIPTPGSTFTSFTLDDQGDLLAMDRVPPDVHVVRRIDVESGMELEAVEMPLRGNLWALTEHDGLWYFVDNDLVLYEFDPIEQVVLRTRALPEALINLQIASMVVDEPLPVHAELRCSPIDVRVSNGSFGSLDINDIVGFAGEFVAGHPNADIAEPTGAHEINDVMSYVTIYADGCRN